MVIRQKCHIFYKKPVLVDIENISHVLLLMKRAPEEGALYGKLLASLTLQGSGILRNLLLAQRINDNQTNAHSQVQDHGN